MPGRSLLLRNGKKKGNRMNRFPVVYVAKNYVFLHAIMLWMIGVRMISIA